MFAKVVKLPLKLFIKEMEIKRYYSRKDKFYYTIALLVVLTNLAVLALPLLTKMPIALTVFLVLQALVILYFVVDFFRNTYYELNDCFLFYKQSFLKGKIEISSISKIEKGRTLWAGIKPALATKGLIITHNKYDEIYVSPENEDEFIEEILKVNDAIIIV
jgi:hypothetical protein